MQVECRQSVTQKSPLVINQRLNHLRPITSESTVFKFDIPSSNVL
jgi:hypothetical protein